jgi:hypothetical protein
MVTIVPPLTLRRQTMPTTDALIPLRGGPAVPASVVAWLLAAEFRGLRLSVVNDRLRVSPRGLIRPDDDWYLRTHRDALLAAVAYVARQAEAPL